MAFHVFVLPVPQTDATHRFLCVGIEDPGTERDASLQLDVERLGLPLGNRRLRRSSDAHAGSFHKEFIGIGLNVQTIMSLGIGLGFRPDGRDQAPFGPLRSLVAPDQRARRRLAVRPTDDSLEISLATECDNPVRHSCRLIDRHDRRVAFLAKANLHLAVAPQVLQPKTAVLVRGGQVLRIPVPSRRWPIAVARGCASWKWSKRSQSPARSTSSWATKVWPTRS